jgi:mannosyltransferase OCH1-like enzyme
MSLIPKNIYKTAPFLHPKLEKLYLNTESENPDWKIKFYNDKDCINFLENEFSKDNLELKKNVLNSYNKLIPSAYKADLWRLCVIYEYGGVYSDASQIFKIPIDEIIDTTKEFCIIKDKTYSRKQGLQIGLFSSIKKHPFLLKYIEEINNNVQNRTYGVNCLHVTGPGLAYDVANKYKFLDKLTIIGKQYGGNGYVNEDEIQIVQKSEFHLDVVYNEGRNQHYSHLWKYGKIYKIDDKNKSQKKNTALNKKQTIIKKK